MNTSKLLLVRHAERMPISHGNIGNKTSLTERGKVDAIEFASKLDSPVISISSSPLLRCKQTAELIAHIKGFEQSSILFDKDLGDPGYFIDDATLAWSHWQEKGEAKVNEYLLSGTEKWSGFKSFTVAVAAFEERIHQVLISSQNGLHIWITHDTILASFVSRVLDNKLTTNKWPRYLDYLSVELTSNKLNYYYSNS